MNDYPNLATAIICKKLEEQRGAGQDLTGLTVNDVKGALLNGVPLRDKTDIYLKLLQVVLGEIDWKFVDNFLYPKIEQKEVLDARS